MDCDNVISNFSPRSRPCQRSDSRLQLYAELVLLNHRPYEYRPDCSDSAVWLTTDTKPGRASFCMLREPLGEICDGVLFPIKDNGNMTASILDLAMLSQMACYDVYLVNTSMISCMIMDCNLPLLFTMQRLRSGARLDSFLSLPIRT